MKKTDNKKPSPLPNRGSEGVNGLTECQAVLSDRSRTPLLRTGKVGGGASLEWLPTWEGVLMYDPEDLRQDRPVRIWHVMKNKRLGNKTVRYEIKPTFDGGYYQKKRSQGLAPRCIFQIRHQGRQVILLRAHATMLAYFGFAPSDRWEWVIDHINCNTLDDRPSNLQVIRRRENILRSKKLKEYRGLSYQEKHRRSQLRIAWKERMRPHVIAALGPGATAIDVEMELTQLLIEHETLET